MITCLLRCVFAGLARTFHGISGCIFGSVQLDEVGRWRTLGQHAMTRVTLSTEDAGNLDTFEGRRGWR